MDHGGATIEGGDVMPLSPEVVAIGMGERSSPQGVAQLARALFAQQGVKRVIAAQLPRSRGAMHLDTVFTFCDHDLVTIFPEVVNSIHTISLRPGEREGELDVRAETAPFLDVVASAIGVPKLRTVATGGDEWEPLTNGLPQSDCYVNVLRDAMAVDSLDDCGIYFGTTGGQVYCSPDGGDTWSAIVRDLPAVCSVEVQTLP